MNCANHQDAPAVAYCRTCGKPLCSTCARDAGGAIQCDQCLASPPPGATVIPPVAAPPSDAPRPALAAILGCIPGVGAMYNGEFAKGFIHVLIFATLIWMTDNINGVFGLAIAAFVIYMPIEAYKTARAREMGLPPPDPFGFNNLFSPAASAGRATGAANVGPVEGNSAVVPPSEPATGASCSRAPIGALILIGLGVLFLLDEMNLLHFDWIWRFWPLILIALGVRILMQRQRRGW